MTGRLRPATGRAHRCHGARDVTEHMWHGSSSRGSAHAGVAAGCAALSDRPANIDSIAAALV
jgi:hypothetical protein